MTLPHFLVLILPYFSSIPQLKIRYFLTPFLLYKRIPARKRRWIFPSIPITRHLIHFQIRLYRKKAFRHENCGAGGNGNDRQTLFPKGEDDCHNQSGQSGQRTFGGVEDGGNRHDRQNRIWNVIQKRQDEPVVQLVLDRNKWNDPDQIG